MEQDRINLFQGLKADGNYSKDYNAFIKQYFSNETGVNDLWGKLINGADYSKPLKDFYAKYACDLTWAKNSTYCGGSGSTNNTNTTNMFACLLKDPDLKLQKDVVIYTSPDDKNRKWYFYSNYRYFQTKTKHKGTWSCDGSDSYIIKKDNGEIYSSKTNEWTDTPTSSSSSGTSITDTNLTANDLAGGKTVSVGMRGDIVTSIQELLIDKGFVHVSKNDKADGIFGNRTKRMVMAFQAANGLKDDGIVGKDTWAKLNGTAATNNASQASSVNNPDEVAGSDSVIIQENRKKILRKYLQEFK